MSCCWWEAIKPCHLPAFLGCHIMYKETPPPPPPPTQPLPPIPPISPCVLMATLPSGIMTSQALLPCRLCLTQFLQQPPCVSGKMDSVRQQQWFMGNSGTSTSGEVRCGRMNLWQIGEGRGKRDRERDGGAQRLWKGAIALVEWSCLLVSKWSLCHQVWRQRAALFDGCLHPSDLWEICMTCHLRFVWFTGRQRWWGG